MNWNQIQQKYASIYQKFFSNSFKSYEVSVNWGLPHITIGLEKEGAKIIFIVDVEKNNYILKTQSACPTEEKKDIVPVALSKEIIDFVFDSVVKITSDILGVKDEETNKKEETSS